MGKYLLHVVSRTMAHGQKEEGFRNFRVGLIKKFCEPQRSDYTKSHMQDKQAQNQLLIFPESANGTSYLPIF